LALTLGRYSEGEAAYDAALKLRAGPNALAFKIILAFQLYGKLDEALALLKNAPGNFWLKEGKTALAAWLWLCKGDPKHALSVLGAVQSDYLEAGGALEFAGPRGVLTGSAQKMSGNLDAAQIEWRAALQVVEHRLTVTPNEPPLYFWKAWLFANLGQAADSRAALKIYEQYAGIKGPRINRGLSFEADLAQLYLLLGERAAVLDALDDREKFLRDRKLPEEAAILRNRLTYDPAWDALRGDKRFEALLGRLADIAASSR
jgi:tetratricopeptide (TPR) repeat protein